MNIFFKQAGRKPAFTLLMVLLLSFSIALSCVGYSAWTSVKIQIEEISNGYTTIAVLRSPRIPSTKEEEAEWGDLTVQSQRVVFADLAAQKAPQLAMIDRRCLLSAHIAGSRSLSSSSVDPKEYDATFDEECYSLAVFALRCESVLEDQPLGLKWYDAAFRVEEVVSLSAGYDTLPEPDSVHIVTNFCEENGDIPFEEGKTYLVFGQYKDRPFILTPAGVGQSPVNHRYIIPFPEIGSNFDGEVPSHQDGEQNGIPYWYPTPGLLPWVCEYTGTVAEYLSSDAGRVWREEILPICQINQESAAVILTDSIESMYSFNTGNNELLSGRFFTEEEYAEGADVCVVSAAYAQLNDLQLGDTIQIDYYDSDSGLSWNSASESKESYRSRNYMTPDDAIDVCKEYTIVGLYTGARFGFGAYQVNGDTIFVPKASVPHAEDYEEVSDSLLNSFVLKNGTAEEFEQYMEQQELGGQFLYFDQEFASMQESLDALETNAMRLMMVGAGVLVLACALFLFLNFRRMKGTVRGARLLGRSSKAVFTEMTVVLMSLELLAAVIGTGIAAVLFDTVTEKVLSTTLALRPEAMVTACAAAFAFLAIASMTGAGIFARRKLMKAK